jgi:hypothetical protein
MSVRMQRPDKIKDLLDGCPIPLNLTQAFIWSSTPEGDPYWRLFYRTNTLSNEARIKLLKIYLEYKEGF